MLTIFDLITPNTVKEYWEASGSNKIPYLGSLLFPVEKQVGLELSFIKGKDGLPITLKGSAFDSDVPFRDRVGLEKTEHDMPFFREGISINEKERQELLKVISSGNQKLIDAIINRIFKDKKGLIDSAFVTKERMIMQLIAYGKITLNFEGSPVTYDYDFNPEHKITLMGTEAFSDTENSDVTETLNTMADKIEADSGIRPTKAICTRNTFNLLKKNKKITEDIKITQKYVNEKSLREYLLDTTGISIAVYSKKFSGGQFYPENSITLIPDEPLGNFVYGTTPEEADLMAVNDNSISVELLDKGIAISVQPKKSSPVNVKTVVSMIGLPSAETMNKWAIIKW